MEIVSTKASDKSERKKSADWIQLFLYAYGMFVISGCIFFVAWIGSIKISDEDSAMAQLVQITLWVSGCLMMVGLISFAAIAISVMIKEKKEGK